MYREHYTRNGRSSAEPCFDHAAVRLPAGNTRWYRNATLREEVYIPGARQGHKSYVTAVQNTSTGRTAGPSAEFTYQTQGTMVPSGCPEKQQWWQAGHRWEGGNVSVSLHESLIVEEYRPAWISLHI